MLKLINVSKKYGDFFAVKSLSLNINKGEIFGFLGPNGAGKTTTIKMMSGLTTITEGEIFIDDINIKKEPEKYKKKIALIPDKPYTFDKLRGIEYINFVANLYNVNKEQYYSRLQKYSEIFEINDYINDFLDSYSHGMSQRLLIVAALIHSPDVLILDEPMVGLDPKSQKTLKFILKEYVKEGKIVFLSTHSLDVAEEVCSTVGIIDKGTLLANGTLSDIKTKNKSEKLEDVFFRLTEK